MSAPWVLLTTRFRPDQITKFQELYPEKQFAPIMRMLLDTFLDGKNATPKRLYEVKRLREKISKQLLMLEQEEAELVKTEQSKIMIESLERYRAEFLQKNPIWLEKHHNNAVSNKGYRKLQIDLKFTSVAQVKEYLSKKDGNNPPSISAFSGRQHIIDLTPQPPPESEQEKKEATADSGGV